MRSLPARLLAFTALAPLAAAAQTITIGLAADVTSIDPHFHVLGPNQNIAERGVHLRVRALATVDDPKRERLLQQATEIAVGDLGIIPLYHQLNVWATRKGIAYAPRTDERTYAFELKPR
jgi:ABC-type transport system substrate-binding protein